MCESSDKRSSRDFSETHKTSKIYVGDGATTDRSKQKLQNNNFVYFVVTYFEIVNGD